MDSTMDHFNFKEDEGTSQGIHNLQLLLDKLQEAQENPRLHPAVQNLLATRELTLKSTLRPPSRLGEPLPKDDNPLLKADEVSRGKAMAPLQPNEGEGQVDASTMNHEAKDKERTPSPTRGRKRRRSQERVSRRRESSSEESSSSSKSGRSPHGRFPRGREQPPPSPPSTPSSTNESSPHETSSEDMDSSYKRRHKTKRAAKKKRTKRP